jgi:pyruvate/2-oxoglutarate dehydrogenase complex dihydrolipoamide dehydrogenase (E3) component
MKNFDYDLLVIGGGAGGFVSSKLAVGLGKRVAMVEKRNLGGDCTWFGCIPSKALIKASRVAYQSLHLENFGLRSEEPLVLNTDSVMSHVRSVVQKVYNTHLPESFEKVGINLFFGEPQFIDNHSIKLEDKILSARKFIIATGSSAFIPPIEGLDKIPYLTNETVFDLDILPKSMIALGGGPVSVELSSALNRLGVKVTVVQRRNRILVRDDRELVERLASQLQAQGLKILTNAQAIKFAKENGKIVLTVQREENQISQIKADTALIAVGRKANVDGLFLENAGVTFTPKGIKTNRFLQTTAKNIYACGDVVGPYRFSHMAEYQAKIATTNAFLPIKRKVDYKNVIWCTFTDPELAHAGLTEKQALNLYSDKIMIYRYEYRNIDRARTEVSEAGISKFICDDKGRLIGAHILGDSAGEILHEAQLAKTLNIPFAKIYSAIHAYPSFSDVLRQPAKLCYIDALEGNPFIRLFKKLMAKKR